MRIWSDEEICQGFTNQETRVHAFRALCGQHGSYVLGVLTHFCRGDKNRAEDLLTDTLMKASRALMKREKPPDSLKGWLYQVARSVCQDELRCRMKEGRDPATDALPLLEEVIGETCPAPEVEEENSRHLLLIAVQETLEELETLKPQYHQLLTLEYCARWERADIAAVTGIAQRQISPYLNRAKELFLKLARKRSQLADLE